MKLSAYFRRKRTYGRLIEGDEGRERERERNKNYSFDDMRNMASIHAN
jgi:hypothetical protein